MKQNNKIIIVGAGIVGTTLAWYLSRHFKGQITLIDAHEAASGVTQHAFAWLNVSYGRPNEYSAFRKQALDEWRSLDKLTQGQLGINWSGAISWQHDREATQQFIDSHKKQDLILLPSTSSSYKHWSLIYLHFLSWRLFLLMKATSTLFM